MSLILGLLAAFACFTRIPMPTLPWDRRTTRLLMAALPVVGVAIACLVWLADQAMRAAGFSDTLRGVVVALAPVLVTGGIHLDGFADVTDALASHADAAVRRQILKDPHVGAFAVIGLASYLMLAAALTSELDARHVGAWCATYVVSRVACAAASLTWRARPESGMLLSLRKGADVRRSLVLIALELVVTLCVAYALDPACAAALTASGLVCYGVVRRVSERAFDGMSGDVAGYLLCVSELAMQAAVVLAGRVW